MAISEIVFLAEETGIPVMLPLYDMQRIVGEMEARAARHGRQCDRT
jgi:hypothetical protein